MIVTRTRLHWSSRVYSEGSDLTGRCSFRWHIMEGSAGQLLGRRRLLKIGAKQVPDRWTVPWTWQEKLMEEEEDPEDGTNRRNPTHGQHQYYYYPQSSVPINTSLPPHSTRYRRESDTHPDGERLLHTHLQLLLGGFYLQAAPLIWQPYGLNVGHLSLRAPRPRLVKNDDREPEDVQTGLSGDGSMTIETLTVTVYRDCQYTALLQPGAWIYTQWTMDRTKNPANSVYSRNLPCP